MRVTNSVSPGGFSIPKAGPDCILSGVCAYTQLAHSRSVSATEASNSFIDRYASRHRVALFFQAVITIGFGRYPSSSRGFPLFSKREWYAKKQLEGVPCTRNVAEGLRLPLGDSAFHRTFRIQLVTNFLCFVIR